MNAYLSSALSLTLSFLVIANAAFADLNSDPKLKKIVLRTTQMLQAENVNHLKIDDEISARAYKLFLKQLDSTKVYFTADDIAEFSKYETLIDDEVLEGSLGFADLVISRLKQRIDERLETIRSVILPGLVDFSADESVSLDYDARMPAANADEANERLRKDVKRQVLSLKLGDEKASLEDIKKKVLKAYDRSAKAIRAQTDMEWIERYLDSFAHAFDPHSDYMSPETAEQFKINMALKLGGVGASLREDEDGTMRVEDVVAGGPAAVDGTLKKGDRIIGVASDGNVKNIVEGELAGMSFNKKVNLIRGKLGTRVLLRIIPGGDATQAPVDLVLTRAEIKVEEAKAVSDVKEVTSLNSSKTHKVGEIYLPSFYRDFEGCNRLTIATCTRATNDIKKILLSKEFKDVEAVVLDLRDNGGGSLAEAIDIVGLFIDQGPVVQVKQGANPPDLLQDKNPGALYTGPLTVLVNQASASASEIVAAALQDWGRGIVVGGDTFGKGTVQTVKEVAEEGLLSLFNTQARGALGTIKVTVQEFFRINGDSTQGPGVIPNVKVPGMYSIVAERESNLPYAFKNSKTDVATYTKYTDVTEEIEKKVNALSLDRRSKSAAFAKFQKDMDETKLRIADKTVSLNEEKRKKEIEAQKDENDVNRYADGLPLVSPKKASGKAIEPNFYNEEMLQISVDYLELLQQAQPVAAANAAP